MRVQGRCGPKRLSLIQALLLSLEMSACSGSTDIGFRDGSPMANLPEWITPLGDIGLRPDWSADTQRIVYLDALVGNVHELTIETGAIRPLTAHFEHEGFTRARYLSSGDILLCGPSSVAAAGEEKGRWNTELWFLGKALQSPAQPLNEPCFEGPAVSRLDMQIAWTRSDFPDKVLFGRSELWTGRVVVEDGEAQLIDRRKVIDRSAFMYLAFLETQDFRPPDETELLFTAYGYKGGEVMGIDLDSGEWTNYSHNWAYDEAEGVFPDGKTIAVEREVDTYGGTPVGDIDIWRLVLDGSGVYQRLTYFSEYAGFGANNPVISPDGRYMAFGLRIKGDGHGNARGILLYDFDKAPK
jgi:hypothetical protein